MARFSLIQHEGDRSLPDAARDAEVEFTFSADTWPDVLPQVDAFLRGCGFLPPTDDSVLTYISEDDDDGR